MNHKKCYFEQFREPEPDSGRPDNRSILEQTIDATEVVVVVSNPSSRLEDSILAWSEKARKTWIDMQNQGQYRLVLDTDIDGTNVLDFLHKRFGKKSIVTAAYLKCKNIEVYKRVAI